MLNSRQGVWPQSNMLMPTLITTTLTEEGFAAIVGEYALTS